MTKRMNISSLKVQNWKPVLLIAVLAAGFVWFLKTNTSVLEGMEDSAKDTTAKDSKESSNTKNGKVKNGSGKTLSKNS